jgi:glycosyltransferase involved in cell wall biosynthesis
MTAVGRRTVSVVCTVLNEAANLRDLLGSLAAQTRRPDEVVVLDGGSTDGTWELIENWHDAGFNVVALRQPGANISRGRNEAIRASRGEIIAVTDAGVRLETDWLAALVAPFESADPPDLVSGFFAADPRSYFELALGATTLPTADEIRPDRFLPSSRSVAMFRTAWEQVGGYPEWLDYCEDLVFDLNLRQAGLRFAWAPEALVHFRPRPDARRFFEQYYRYARGDGKALLWTKRHLIRYATYAGAAALIWRSRGHPFALALVTLGGLLYCKRPLQRLAPSLPRLSISAQSGVLALVPALRLIGDVAKMLGYPAGLYWRLRHRDVIPCSQAQNSATLPSP